MDGTISRKDFDTLKAWSEFNDDHKAYVKQRIEILFSIKIIEDKTQHNRNKAYQRFLANIGYEKAILTPKHQNKSKALVQKWIAAAAIILLLIIPFVTYHLGTKEFAKKVADFSVEVPMGSQLKISLPDGTKVHLNSGSKITYSQGYGITNRDVNFQGQGFFEVKHQKRLPFRVRTKSLQLNDLGTEFELSDYEDDNHASVQLFSGLVSIDNNILHTTNYIIYPGKGIIIDKKTGKMQLLQNTKDKNATCNMADIIFEDKDLLEIAKVLTRIYDVRIEVSPQVSHKHFYGSFNRNEYSLNQILKHLSGTGEFHYKYTGKKYLIYE